MDALKQMGAGLPMTAFRSCYQTALCCIYGKL